MDVKTCKLHVKTVNLDIKICFFLVFCYYQLFQLLLQGMKFRVNQRRCCSGKVSTIE